MKVDFFNSKTSLRWKILLGYLIIAGLLLVTSGWAIYNFIILNQAIKDIMISSYRSVVASQKMVEALEEQNNSVSLFFLHQSATDHWNRFVAKQREFNRWYLAAKRNVTFPGEPESLQRIQADYRLYLSDFQKLRQLSAANQPAELSRFYLEILLPQFSKVKQECYGLLEINQKHMVQAHNRAKANAGKAIFSTTLVSLLALLLAIFFGYKISAIIITPTLRLTESAKKIGEGRLEEAIQVETLDEIGRLAEEFNRMTSRLKEYDRHNIDQLIAERRRANAIVRSIPDPLIVVDAEYRIIAANSAAEKLFLIAEKQVKGAHILEVINVQEIYHTLTEITKTHLPVKAASMKSALTFEVNGQFRHYMLEATPVDDKEGNLIGMVVFMGDVTNFKEIDRIKSEFVSTASHEFRTPLTSITMGAGLLLDQTVGEINPKQEQLIRIIQEDCNRLNNLVSELLDLSRMESGKITIIKEGASLLEIIETSIQPLQFQLAEQKIALAINPAIQNCPLVQVDATRITWVFNNLISNALRYTPEGGRISIDARPDHDWVVASVSDTGIGIPKEYQAKIFDKFVQVPNEEYAIGGAGLGLTIVRDIIQAHGGKIWVESEPGAGSTFRFTLPVDEEH